MDHNQIQGNSIEIIGEDVSHIKNVLRYKIGDEILVSNMQDKEYKCEIIKLLKDKVILKILKEHAIQEDAVNITLFQGLPKKDKMELIIQKCTELGIKEIVPVITNRVIVKVDQKDKIKKEQRWQKIACEASKQSLRNDILKVLPICELKKTIENINKYDTIILAYEEEKQNKLKDLIGNIKEIKAKNIAIFIGPEGGFNKEEVEFLIKYKAKVITLGKRILRTETAGMYLCCVLMYELNS